MISGLFYEIILVRADGIFEKGILRFQCREDQDGGNVCSWTSSLFLQGLVSHVQSFGGMRGPIGETGHSAARNSDRLGKPLDCRFESLIFLPGCLEERHR